MAQVLLSQKDYDRSSRGCNLEVNRIFLPLSIILYKE